MREHFFHSRTGMLGATESGQAVNPTNVHQLPPGSVVRITDGSRLIHLHDDLWLWCCDGAHCYDRIENLTRYLEVGATLCHHP